MAVKMLACMSSKTLEEAVEANYEKEKMPARSETKSDLRKMKSFTCQTLIHPSWSFKSQGNQGVSPPQASPAQASPDQASPQADGKEEDASEKPVGKGWKSFFAALQCSRAPLRSTDFKGMAAKLTAGACTKSCKPCSTSVSEQDAAHAVHPEAAMENYSEANFSLPVAQYLSPNVLKDDPGSNNGGSNHGGSNHGGSNHGGSNHGGSNNGGSNHGGSNHGGSNIGGGSNAGVNNAGVNNAGSNNGDGPVSARSSQAAHSEQKINSKPPTQSNESPSYASYHMANGAAVKVPEELRNLNRLVPAGTGVPGTEWFSQVELGVFITFVTLSNGCNALKRIRFSRDIFSKKEAESWWAENGNRVRAVYNVPAFERTTTNDHPAASSSEEEVSGISGYATPAYSPQGSRGASMPRDSPAGNGSGVSRGASLRDTSSREASMREASIRESIRESMRDAVSEVSESVTGTERATETDTVHGSEEGSDRTYDGEETTWVEEDVPGVYLTLKNMAGGGRELKRVRFSREKFTEKQAKIWWDENRGRIHKQYL